MRFVFARAPKGAPRPWSGLVFSSALALIGCGEDAGSGNTLDSGSKVPDGGNQNGDDAGPGEDAGRPDKHDAGAEIPTGPNVSTVQLQSGAGYLYSPKRDIMVSFTSQSVKPLNATAYMRMLEASEVEVDLGEHELVAAFEIGFPKGVTLDSSVQLTALMPRPLISTGNQVGIAAYGFAQIDTGKLVPLKFNKMLIIREQPLAEVSDREIEALMETTGTFVLLKHPGIQLKLDRPPVSWPADGSLLVVHSEMTFPAVFTGSSSSGSMNVAPVPAKADVKFMPIASPGKIEGTTSVRCDGAGRGGYSATLALYTQPLFGGENEFGYRMTLDQDLNCVAP